ncbi:hypothetical protein PG988_016171 [Apiospora saccharicola]
MPSGQSITHSYRMELFLNILQGIMVSIVVVALVLIVILPVLIYMGVMWFYFVAFVFELSKATIAELW